MPSARDLLHQADALLRNYHRVGASESDVPATVLTAAAAPTAASPSFPPYGDDIPVLTDAVTMIPDADFDDPREGAPDARFSAITALPDDTSIPAAQMPAAAIPEPVPADDQNEPVFSVAAMQAEPAAVEEGDAALIAPAPAAPQPFPAAADPGAAEIAETVYYQVLQNLDLYTEHALQEHLTAHLSPILERASSELLATLHANLGAVMRQYVADAIEKQRGVRPDSGE